jgi:hypothetical protein
MLEDAEFFGRQTVPLPRAGRPAVLDKDYLSQVCGWGGVGAARTPSDCG